MNRTFWKAGALFVVLVCCGIPVSAEEQAGAVAAQVQNSDRIPIKLQVIISKWLGDQKMTSTPYVLASTTGVQSNLRLGARLPVRGSTTIADSKQQPAPIQFVDVGTNISAMVNPPEAGRFRLQLAMEETSALDSPPMEVRGAAVPGMTTYVNFSYSASVMLKEGEMEQAVASVNRVTGETIKLEILLTVDK